MAGSTPSPAEARRPALTWPVLAATTVLATVVAVGTFVVLRDDGTPAPPSSDAPSLDLVPAGDQASDLSADGDPDGALEVTLLDGGDASAEVTLASVLAEADTPVVVNFFAAWCPPCVTEMPDFDAVATEYGDAVRIVGVSLDYDATDAVDLVERTGIGYRWLFDRRGDLASAIGVTQMPATLFYDATGARVGAQAGAIDAERLRELIAEHLSVAR